MSQTIPLRRAGALRVAALIDLPRTPQSGGHVKCWERLAEAAAASSLPLDLTVYFSGAMKNEVLGPHTQLRQLPPVFSTAHLRFLPYMPDFTDLSPYHPALARELKDYDLLHTTDGYFAYAQTAARVSKRYNIPLVTSFHTDTPSYTRIFTRQGIEKILERLPRLRDKLIYDWDVPERQGRAMERKLRNHLAHCAAAITTRDEDQALAESIVGKAHAHHMRLGVDKTMFGPQRADRAGIERDYGIAPGRIIVLFVGRVDIGKNIYTLANAMEKAIAAGAPLHLIVAGIGPAMDDVRKALGANVSLPGFVEPNELGRLYASVDALALASEVEIRSMAGVESIASACPILVSEKSGIAGLFHNTHAMQPIASSVEDWAEALRIFASDAGKRQHMRQAAGEYGVAHLAGWQNVLAEDIFAVWQGVRDQRRQAA